MTLRIFFMGTKTPSREKLLMVWFGDAPGHDPICTAVSGAPGITEATATAKLVAQGITVLAISTANPGLDGDPKAGAADYKVNLKNDT